MHVECKVLGLHLNNKSARNPEVMEVLEAWDELSSHNWQSSADAGVVAGGTFVGV